MKKKYDKGCKLCKNKDNDSLCVDCCERWIIFLQPDFLAQKSALVEIIKNAGHVCIFFQNFIVNWILLNAIREQPKDIHEIIVITHEVDYKK